jgi:NAD(P)-dependent dehydrogenase (short-subunit alcohol dehydrogenase family)
MQLDLDGRTALITGASKGIGRAIALELAREGVHLSLVARSDAGLESARQEIARQSPVAVRTFPLDMSKSESVDALARDCGDIDILVNNAGAIPRGRIDEIDDKQWREAWDLKVFGYINMTRAFYGKMKARGKGVIINIVGVGGERVDAGYICGAAGNASLMAFTRAIGGASHKHGIRVVGVNPGSIATERFEKVSRRGSQDRYGTPDRREEWIRTLPFGRAGSTAEISAMVALLASDRSAYTTGTIITIDGGIANGGTPR